MRCCEGNDVDYVLGVARDQRLMKRTGKALHKSRHCEFSSATASPLPIPAHIKPFARPAALQRGNKRVSVRQFNRLIELARDLG